MFELCLFYTSLYEIEAMIFAIRSLTHVHQTHGAILRQARTLELTLGCLPFPTPNH